MALRDNILESVAVEEEVLIGVEKVNRKCNTALNYARRLQDLVRETPNIEARA